MAHPEDTDDQDHAEMMTIRDVAQYLRISQAKVYELARNGCIPALRLGKSWRFQRDLLKQWVRASSEANLTWDDKNS